MQMPGTTPIIMMNLEKGKLHGNSPQEGSSADHPPPLEDVPNGARTP